MNMALSPLMRPRVEATLHNARVMLLTFDPQAALFGMPLWKHAYHMLHSCDRWFINPARYNEPPFHTPGLNSLDDQMFEPNLTREDLLAYLDTIRVKVLAYMDATTDEQWAQTPEGYPATRLELLLGQFQHFCGHMGNINAVTMQRTGKWPRMVGMEWQISEQLWE